MINIRDSGELDVAVGVDDGLGHGPEGMVLVDGIAEHFVVLAHTVYIFARAHQCEAAALFAYELADALVKQEVHIHLCGAYRRCLGAVAHYIDGLGSIICIVEAEVGFGKQQIGLRQAELHAVAVAAGVGQVIIVGEEELGGGGEQPAVLPVLVGDMYALSFCRFLVGNPFALEVVLRVADIGILEYAVGHIAGLGSGVSVLGADPPLEGGNLCEAAAAVFRADFEE